MFIDKAPQIISEIVVFLNQHIDSEDFDLHKQEFIEEKLNNISKNKRKRKKVVRLLDNYSFYRLSLYNRDNISDSELVRLIMLLSHLKGELLDKLTNNSDKENS